MDEERSKPTAYTPIVPPQEELTQMETKQMEQSEDSIVSKKPTTLLIAGFVLVIGLIIVGLFLPPISLGERLSSGGDEADTTTETVISEPSAMPDGFSLSSGAQTINGSVMSLTPEQFAAEQAWASAAAALPANASVKGNVYTIDLENAPPTGRIALEFPAGSASADMLDMFGWDGSGWNFIPSQIDENTRQLVSNESGLPSAVAVLEFTANISPEIGAEVLPTQVLPAEVLPLLTEVSAGTLTLAGTGLQGEVVDVPEGPYEQLLRVTNTGAIVDQTSLVALLGDATAQEDQINMLLGQVVSANYAGVNLDYQGVPVGMAAAYTSFVEALARALHGQGRVLAVTLSTPQQVNNNWSSDGQDWAALGQVADTVFVQMPLDPLTYGDGGQADELLGWATRQISRQKITALFSASAIDRIGESLIAMSNEQALSHFGDLQFVQGEAEVEPGTAIEVTLSGDASPLEWDGSSLSYKYSYDVSGQTHHVWLGSDASLSHQMRLGQRHNVRGVAVRGLGNMAEGSGYAAAFASYTGNGDAPQPAGAAIVWTVRTGDDSVLASSSGETLSYSWEGTEDAGSYSINADFAFGESVASLGSLDLIVAEPEPDVVEVIEATPTPAPTAEPTAAPVTSPGDADAVVNVGANVRVGPGLTYGTIAGGLEAGSRVSVIGRNSDASWINILMPDGETEGWIYSTLITINSSIDINGLQVVQVAPPPPPDPGDPGSTAPPPVTAPPVTNAGFELGGQTHSFGNPTLMSYAGMNWVKFQHKWSNGDSPDAVAGRIQQAQANGFKVLLSIPGANHSSIDYNAYVNFLGGVAALGPNAIEIWNEMNIDREWPSGQINPTTYVNSMLAPAYNAIKAANPNVMVISGAPAPTGFFGGCGGGGCNDDLYMAGMAAAGAANYMDCLGIHYNEGIISPNQTSGDPRNPSDHYTRYFWGMVNAYWNAFGGARQLCFTELGYLSGADYGGLPGGFAWAGGTSVAQHAQWLAEATSLAASSGKVRLLIVFNVDFTMYGEDPQAGFAMIRRDGSCPSCETLRQVMGR